MGAGRPGWCVSVALVEERTPLIGVLDAPARGEHWTARKGGGAWRNGERLRVSSRPDEDADADAPAAAAT